MLTQTIARSRLGACIKSFHSQWHLRSRLISRTSTPTQQQRDEATVELFSAPAHRFRPILAYVGAATQLIFWGNLAQWAGVGYAVKDK